MLLGYYLESIPRVIRPVAKLFATFLIKRESIILEQREIEWSKKADIVSLVSAEEALDLQKKVNRPILSLPMAVDIPEKQQRTQFAENITSAVFVGGLDYQPNLDAIRFYHKKIIPILEAQGLGNFTLEVIGKCTTAVKQEFNTTNIRFLGYVDNLQKELSKYSLFFAPIVSGSGVKTKVLEAMASGLPVVSTNSGVSGLKVENGIHCLIADTPEQFAESVQSAVTNPMLLQDISQNARQYVVSHFSRKVIERKWYHAIKSLSKKTNK
jgi:glycosyltransferase involved in cell wall biosynthesis